MKHSFLDGVSLLDVTLCRMVCKVYFWKKLAFSLSRMEETEIQDCGGRRGGETRTLAKGKPMVAL